MPLPPAFTNIAKLLGDLEDEIEISMYCSSEAVEFLKGVAHFLLNRLH